MPSGLVTVILASSEAGCSKYEGRLFTELLSRFPGIARDRILHVGDHPRSDGVQARAAGLRTRLHDTGVDSTRDVFRHETLRHGAVVPELASLRCAATVTNAPEDPGERWWFGFGAAVLGPVLAAFADWVVQECVRDGVRVVKPLMREGKLLAALISRAARASSADLSVSPLYASRSATWLASLASFDAGAVHHLLQRQHLTVAELFDYIGIGLEDAGVAIAAARHVRLADAGRFQLSDRQRLGDALMAFLGRADVRARVDRTITDARRVVRRYIDQECESAADVALVDLGFHATIGRALELAAGSATRQFHHFLMFGAETVARLWASGCDVRVFAAGPGQNADLAGIISRHPALLETLLIEAGTTLGYDQTASGVIAPRLQSDDVSEAQRTATRTCRAGVLAFQERWLEWKAVLPDSADSVIAERRALAQIVHRAIDFPTSEEAKHLGALVHEDNFGGRSATELANPAHIPSGIDADAFLNATLSAAPAFGRSWHWPAGVCERRWPGHLERRWRQALGTLDAAPPAMPRLAMHMRQAGVRRCIVWGAGEAGQALMRAIRQEGIEVLAITDSNPAVWGTSVDGVQVVSPADVRRLGHHVFAVGSCAFASDIEATLRAQYSENPNTLRIFSPVSEVAA
jgi:hypothetical protein